MKIVSPSNELLASVSENNRISFHTDFDINLKLFIKECMKVKNESETEAVFIYKFNNISNGRSKRQASKDRSNS